MHSLKIYKSGSIIILRLVLTVAADNVMPVKTGHASAADCYPKNPDQQKMPGKVKRTWRVAVPPSGGKRAAMPFLGVGYPLNEISR